MVNAEEKNRRSNELSEEIEREMDAVGATGIEDRLQSGVPRTITALREVVTVFFFLNVRSLSRFRREFVCG